MAQVALAERIGGVADFALAAHKIRMSPAFVAQLVQRRRRWPELIALGIIRLFHTGR